MYKVQSIVLASYVSSFGNLKAKGWISWMFVLSQIILAIEVFLISSNCSEKKSFLSFQAETKSFHVYLQ